MTDEQEHDCLTCKFFDFIESDDEHTYGDCVNPNRPGNDREYRQIESCPYWVSEFDGVDE